MWTRIIEVLLGLLLAWLLITAFSFKIGILDYTLSYGPKTETKIINQTEVNKTLIKDLNNITADLNNIAEVRKALSNMNYDQIGFTDTDTNKRYVAIIKNDMIKDISASNELQADVELKGSLQRISDYAARKDYKRLKLTVATPLRVKLKLALCNLYC